MSLTIGRVILDEGPLRAFEESWSDNGRKVSLSGTLSTNKRTSQELAKMHDDILGLPFTLVPVHFDVKSHRDGYYVVEGAKSSIIELGEEQVMLTAWEIVLNRQGADNEVDLESRLAGPVNRLNDHALTGNRWHSPPIAHEMYWVGSATPSQVARVGSEGTVRTYLGLAQEANPRWHCDLNSYLGARVRLYENEGLIERSGLGITLGPVWGIHNSLIRLDAVTGGGFDVSVWDSGGWSPAKRWNLRAGGANLLDPVSVTVLHNEYESITVRVMWDRSTNGRTWADMTIRRGSRFVDVLMRTSQSATLGVFGGVNEAGTGGTGFVRATSDDASGNRYVIASSRSFTSDLVAGGISKGSTTRFDAMIGSEVGGSAAITGDQAANLVAQYIGSPVEVVQAVKR